MLWILFFLLLTCIGVPVIALMGEMLKGCLTVGMFIAFMAVLFLSVHFFG